MGANLASVHNTNEFHAVQRVIMNHANRNEQTWIGGTDSQEVFYVIKYYQMSDTAYLIFNFTSSFMVLYYIL